MKKINISKLIVALFVGVAIVGCVDAGVDIPEILEFSRGYVTLDFSLSPGTRVESKGESTNNEDAISTVDLFFYDSEVAGENDKAKLAKHISSVSSSVTVSVSELTAAFTENIHKCKVIAVTNCAATKSLTESSDKYPTIGELKQISLSAKGTMDGLRDFHAAKAPRDFVMANLSQTLVIEWDENGGLKGDDGKQIKYEIKLKRVAAKIRVALNVSEAIWQDGAGNIVVKDIDDGISPGDGYTKWTPDLTDMRLFISNGVSKGQLDGSYIDLDANDYYSIVTSGSKGDAATETGDYFLARRITKHDSQTANAPTGESYLYYNDIPYYTYPNSWEDSMLETTRTTLTIVVPWEIKDASGNRKEYRPCYYTIPVNNRTTIEANKYYYLRLHIGMMGSVTPEKPMEVAMQCEIAEWGKAENTVADIRPVRYLIFNQTEFEMNNTTRIEIPFASTHESKVVGFEGQFSDFYIDLNGKEHIIKFDSSTAFYNQGSNTSTGNIFGEDKFYYYEIKDNVLIFSHHFFDIWYYRNAPNGNVTTAYYTDLETIDGFPAHKLTRLYKGTSTIESNTYHKIYSKFEVKLTVRHSTGDPDTDNSNEETIKITLYPAIYLSGEYIPGGTEWQNLGWIYVNGYGDGANTTSSRTNGGLGDAGHTASGNRQVSSLMTLTLTQFSEEEAAKWTIHDPRTYYINNDLSKSEDLEDTEDVLTPWSSMFDGTNLVKSKTHSGTTYEGARTIWQDYPNVESVFWGPSKEKEWIAADDIWTRDNKRTLSYYYPTAESDDKCNIIAPKIIVTSYHAFSDQVNRETARRRCATLQMYGYPAGRWRLPTLSEIEIFKTLQVKGLTRDIFYSGQNNNTSGVGTNWSNIGITGNGTTKGSKTGTSYVRCIYDLWYWEKEDAARIKNESDYYYFTWGDRPKENPLTRSTGGNTVESFLQENSPGNYAITRNGDNVKREKMK